MKNTEEMIKAVIDRVRPILEQDGGGIEYVKFEEGIVYVKMHGACVGCSSINTTLYDGIESILLAEVPDVIGIEAVWLKEQTLSMKY